MTLPMLRPSGPVVRWDPLREFDELQNRMNQLVASTFGAGAEVPSMWTPLADVTETEGSYLVEIDVPGVRREEINIEVNGSELAVAGEFKEREREGLLRKRARRVGRFEHRTMLPPDADTENIRASLEEGVLTVRVPKSEAAKPRRIAIGEGGNGKN